MGTSSWGRCWRSGADGTTANVVVAALGADPCVVIAEPLEVVLLEVVDLAPIRHQPVPAAGARLAADLERDLLACPAGPSDFAGNELRSATQILGV